MANAYTAFAGDGKVCKPIPIESITDSSGNDVPFTKSKCSQAIEPRVAAGVAYTLEYTVQSGLARHARSAIGVPHLAKTGTTDDVVDNWTVGASSKISTAVWVGNVTGKVGMRVGSTVQVADTRIWPAIMNVADQKYGGDAFPAPDNRSTTTQMANLPDMTGKSYADADRLLTDIGFTVVDGGEADSDQPAGVVAKSEPAGGSSVPAGAEVKLFRSNATMSAVPGGITGVTVQAAKNTLNSAGFTDVNAVCSDPTLPAPLITAIVASANPASGTVAKRSNRVTLTVTCAPPPPP
jgi:membrane peptidoglycan carboxypeptidase